MKYYLLLFCVLSFPVFGQEKPEPDSLTYTMVQQMPEFPGGEDSLFAFIRRNMNYPEEASKKGKVGKVYVKFVVDTEGKVSNLHVT